MRKLGFVLALVVVLTLLLAAPALAQQRDPFQPLVTEGTGTTTTAPGGDGTVQPAPQAPVSGEGLANTGSDSSGLLIVAYLLIAAGAGALAWASLPKSASASPSRRR